VMVQCEGDVVTVTDLGSTNGTTVNGRRIDGPTAVTEADVVRFGTTELELLRRGSAAGDEDHMTAVAAGAPRGTLVTGSDAAVVRGRADATAARRTSIDVVAAAVGAEHPNAARLTADGGTITIVFSDIESSTEMAVALGDAQWMGLLRKHNEIIRKHVKNHRGTEIKSQGDGFMLSFPSARAAVLAMIDIQRDLTVYAAEHPETASEYVSERTRARRSSTRRGTCSESTSSWLLASRTSPTVVRSSCRRSPGRSRRVEAISRSAKRKKFR